MAELPQVWRQKYTDYLGITPRNDREGVLQDIQWAAGYMGYFPGYLTSNLMAAQFAAALERELGPFAICWLPGASGRSISGWQRGSTASERSIRRASW